jgi:site-specific recombinase XerD
MPEPKPDLEIRISSSAHIRGSKTAPYRFLETQSGQKTDKIYLMFRPAKLKGKWPNKFVEYYYRNPETAAWKRFKVFEDINRNKTAAYDKLLLDAVNDKLKSGFSPFTDVDPYEPKPKPETVPYTIQRALNYFLLKWKERGQDPETIVRYDRAIRYFEAWLLLKGIQFMAADEITQEHIEQALVYNKTKREWSNRTYNNNKDFLSTCFTYLQKKAVIKINPCSDISDQKIRTRKHRYYDTSTLNKIMEVMKKEDPYLHFAAQVVYHLCVRSEKELQNLMVGNIYPDRMQVLLEITKTKADRYIPMDPLILKIFQERGIFDYPKDYYLFPQLNKTKFVPDGPPGTEPFTRNFFSRRFVKIRTAAKLSSDYTLYGFKHTRVIHLKQDGAQDAEIMNLTGHKDFASYAAYLRDLGIDVNPENIHRLSRHI